MATSPDSEAELRWYYEQKTTEELLADLAVYEEEIRESERWRLKFRELTVMKPVKTEDDLTKIEDYHHRIDEFAGHAAVFKRRAKVLKEVLNSRKFPS